MPIGAQPYTHTIACIYMYVYTAMRAVTVHVRRMRFNSFEYCVPLKWPTLKFLLLMRNAWWRQPKQQGKQVALATIIIASKCFCLTRSSLTAIALWQLRLRFVGSFCFYEPYFPCFAFLAVFGLFIVIDALWSFYVPSVYLFFAYFKLFFCMICVLFSRQFMTVYFMRMLYVYNCMCAQHFSALLCQRQRASWTLLSLHFSCALLHSFCCCCSGCCYFYLIIR